MRADNRPSALFRFAVADEGRGWRLAVGSAGFAGHQLAEVMVPVVVGLVVDRAIGPGNGEALAFTLLALVAVFVVLVASWQTADRLITRVHARGEHAVRQRTVGSVLRGGRVRRAPGEVLTIASSDAAQVAGFSWVVAEQAGAVAALVASGVVLASISWLLVVGVLVCTLAQIGFVQLMSGRLRRRSYEAQRLAARIDALGTDFALGLRALQALGAADEAKERYRAESAVAAAAAYRAERSGAALSTVNTVVAAVSFATITAIAGALAQSGAIGVGAFIVGVGLAQAVRRPLQTIGYLPGSLAAKHGSATRVGELLEQTGPEPATRPLHPATRVAPPRGAALSLTLGTADVAVARGRIVGIRADDDVAADLADLFAARRAARPAELVVDGVDAALLPVDELRRLVFAPPHHAALFSGSIRDNLAAGGAVAGRDLDAAIVASGLDEVVSRVPGGLDEPVGENGGRLSGGQRQRLLLARALCTDHPVLVLHDPTTAVDPVTETRIASSVASHSRDSGRTLVFITTSAVLLSVCDEVVTVLPAAARA